ncbi:MAG: carboxypeptidase-like regulatory domain-containing protein [Candidatus Bathyarchaeota archaeon]|nr:carboxypeptidase-like regulatory domain-containing protein [Candidatus Termitimicrobium sp.]
MRTFNNLEPGTYTVTISGWYCTYTETVVVVAGENAKVDFETVTLTGVVDDEEEFLPVKYLEDIKLEKEYLKDIVIFKRYLPNSYLEKEYLDIKNLDPKYLGSDDPDSVEYGVYTTARP